MDLMIFANIILLFQNCKCNFWNGTNSVKKTVITELTRKWIRETESFITINLIQDTKTLHLQGGIK